jgi:hypothetical protein
MLTGIKSKNEWTSFGDRHSLHEKYGIRGWEK